MTIIEALRSYLKGKDTFDAHSAPEGFCPNCWGRQDYGGLFFEAVQNQRTAGNDVTSNIGWIQAYAEKHLQAIQTVEQGDEIHCPKCKLIYK